MSAKWKPCDRLTPDDFAKHAVWTYDLERAESDDAFDDTWVRPAKPGVDRLDEEVFVRASLVDSDGKAVPNCALALRLPARQSARPTPTALVALSPYYAATPVIDGARVASTLSPALQRRLPIAYVVDVKAGGRHIQSKGKLALWVPERVLTPPPVFIKPAPHLPDPAAPATKAKAKAPPKKEASGPKTSKTAAPMRKNKR